MHHRRLTPDISVSVLGIGSSPFRNGTPAVCAELVQQAVDLGITYYDTARSYINGEETIAHLPTRTKQDLVITTKTGARGGKLCLLDLQTSLTTMRREWIDVWMTHMVETEHEYELCTELGGFCDIATAAKTAGLVRAIGASFHASTEVIRRAIEERAFDVVMFPFNVIGRETVFGSSIKSYREILLPSAHSKGVGVVVMKVLAGGEMRHGVPGLTFLADKARGRNTIGGAIRYAAMNPFIATSVVGMSSTDELVMNVLATDDIDDTLAEEFDAWTQLAAPSLHGECTRCGQCLDVCPESIEIPKVMRIYDQARFLHMYRFARYKYAQLEIDASACTRCRKCEEVCPENLNIELLLNDAHELIAVR